MKPFEVFFDGACPLCTREIAFVRRRDAAGALRFVDISDPAFDPRSVGRTHGELMARLHGRDADGAFVDGVEVFRRMYAAIGFGPIVAVTRWAPVAWVLDASYRWFSRNRLRLTGRCEDGTCKVHA